MKTWGICTVPVANISQVLETHLSW